LHLTGTGEEMMTHLIFTDEAPPPPSNTLFIRVEEAKVNLVIQVIST